MPKQTKAYNSAHLKTAFLAAFAECGNVSLSVAQVGIGRRTHYDWLEKDPDYAVAFEDARRTAGDVLEAEARRRAVDGTEVPVGWYRGQPGGYIPRYSDNLLMFLLKAARPEKYRERHENTGDVGEFAFKVHLPGL